MAYVLHHAPIVSVWSDLVAAFAYLLAFVVCASWAGIALAHLLKRFSIWWASLTLAYASAAASFLMMGLFVGWNKFLFFSALRVSRLGILSASVFGAIVTAIYLSAAWKRRGLDDSQ